MSYPAYVSNVSYCYDGSFRGFLCCVFESYAHRELPAAIQPPQEGQTSLFGSREIATRADRAARVAAGLHRLGAEIQACVTSGFLADEPGKDLVLLHFLRCCFENGPAAAQMLARPEIAEALALARRVDNESHKYIEFLRFERRGEMLGTVIHPRHRILPLLRGHFCSRLPEEDFMIFDATHGLAMLRKDKTVRYLQMQHYAPAPDAEEENWQALWIRFFRALAIEERRNERCQRTHAPKRYWQDMCEMQAQKRTTQPPGDVL